MEWILFRLLVRSDHAPWHLGGAGRATVVADFALLATSFLADAWDGLYHLEQLYKVCPVAWILREPLNRTDLGLVNLWR